MSTPFVPTPEQLRVDAFLKTTERALLFIGMGVGKTAACLARARDMIFDLEITGLLVVAPLRVATLTWPAEVEDWNEFNWMKIADLRTKQGRLMFRQGAAHIYIINYEFIPQFVKMLVSHNGPLPYQLEIWDESTKAKNPTAKRINLFRQNVPRAPHRWALTGTPQPNSLLDLFAQVRLVDDGARLGSAFSEWRKQNFKSNYQQTKWEVNDPAAASRVESKISDITLTIESTGMWPTSVIDVDIPLPAELRERYDELETTMLLEMQEAGKAITAANAAALVTKLLQFTSGALYDAERQVHVEHTLKVDALRKIVKGADSPVLVGVGYIHEYERLRKAFPDACFTSDAVTTAQQKQQLEDWNTDKVPMLVGHPASMGHGLNMQYAAWNIVWFTLTYNREHYEQMIGRLARRGQPNSVVNVFRLICPGTVDDVVADSLEHKAADERSLLKALMRLEALHKNRSET